MSAVHVHSQDGGGGNDFAGDVGTQPTDRLEADFEKLRPVGE
jgi:hypothetical protein